MRDWAPRGGVTLIGSIARRDPLLYARLGHRLAIAPSLELLSRLDWVGRDLDETGFLFAVGRDTLRRHVGERTILKHVHALPDGTGVVFDLQGTRTITCEPFEPLTRFTGSFTEAMDEADALLRTIMRQRVARAPGVACLLSGGPGSSLTTPLPPAGRRWVRCRRRTAEERAKLAPTMRAPGDCPRERAAVGVKVELDGRPVADIVAPPAGLSLSLIHISEPTRPY